MPMDLRTSGNLKIALPLLIVIVTVIVNIALTVNNKVDREKVQACELKINTLETEQRGLKESLDDIKGELKEIRGENKEILERLAGIAAKQGSGK